jgi:Tfp pilus assembly protein PilV
MVALLVLGVALLGLARATGEAIGIATDARAQASAARAAATRVEQLRAAGCVAASGTATVAPGVREYWTAQAGAGWTDLRDSVAYRTHRGPRAVIIADRAPC